ncbi:coiled-coil domain-containing protein 12 isoform X1 [Macadamia integrifolia]|uniref:coiled-coil domain-containing protein 12 isoform X1 n=2 Tax=Macadamia integrifolia TaxID=60698 RepID=UPI001C4F8574|nr:coiled-coil domain-containing protein 12 isoform X1 [Macadamia integrifolia]
MYNVGEVMTTEEESIEQAAAARRERLKALRAAQELLNTPDDDSVPNEDKKEDSDDADEEESLSMKFRNYLPHDKQLQEGKLAAPVLPKFEDPIATEPPAPEETKDPFVNIAPKKPNWDLKRDVLKKLEKLERRTQKAVVQLMEEQQKENEAMAEENGLTAAED